MPKPAATALLGAFVADAASLGLHWLYEPERIAAIVADNGGSGAFVPADAANYAGAKGVFVHAARPAGGLTQYGEVLRVALSCVVQSGKFEVAAFQTAYSAHFGSGGTFQGYIDRPTRGTLNNIAAGRLSPSGIDDDQLPALASIPAVIAVGGDVDAAVCVSNDNDVARAHGRIFAQLLQAVLDGGDVADALRETIADVPADIAADLRAALDSDEDSSTAYAEITGRACHLPMGMPLIFHILSRSETFANAAERNIAAGGDSAGRAIVIGAVMGARYGIGDFGIPLEWILATEGAATLWSECRSVAD